MYTLVDRAASLYGIPSAILKPLRGGHFSQVFAFNRNDKPYIFRMIPPDELLPLERMLAILDWMDFLANQGAPVPRLVRSQRGSLLEVIEQDEGDHMVVVMEAAPGVLSEEFPFEKWDDALFSSLGRSVGKLHAAAKGYAPPRGDFPRPVWHTAGESYTPPPLSDFTQATIGQKHIQAIRHLQTLPRDPAGYGIIHGGLHFGNFFVDSITSTITISDFDDCTYGWYIMDVATLLRDVLVLYNGQDRDAFAVRFLRNFLKGYLVEHHLNLLWVRQLPHFLKLLEIELYLRVYRDYAAGKGDWWINKFMPGRKERIEKDIPYVNLNLDGGG